MSPLLHHVNLITNSSDRGEVEAAVITAVKEMLGATRTELHKIFMPPGDVLVGLAAEIDSSEHTVAVTYDDGYSWPEQIGSIESSPHLQNCIGNDSPCQELLTDGNVRTVVPISNQRQEPYAFLLIFRPAPLTAFEFDIAAGFVKLLKNCLALLDYSETDTLTGLRNRKAFDKCMARVLANVHGQDEAGSGVLRRPFPNPDERDRRDYWLGMVDVDHFRPINDRLGHLAGDEVLTLISNLLHESFRIQDRLFRFGGEMFYTLLRPTSFFHARATFERFRAQVERCEFPKVGHVTVSIGYKRIKACDTPATILDAAEAALDWAKAHGRNQCHAHETLIAGKI